MMTIEDAVEVLQSDIPKDSLRHKRAVIVVAEYVTLKRVKEQKEDG